MLRATLLILALALPAHAQAQAKQKKPVAIEVWTGVIATQFVGNAYTWRLQPGGQYAEEGVSIADGEQIQSTQFGRWERNGKHMKLTQEHNAYGFEGVINGDEFSGTFYVNGQRASTFCAVRGHKPPKKTCDSGKTS